MDAPERNITTAIATLEHAVECIGLLKKRIAALERERDEIKQEYLSHEVYWQDVVFRLREAVQGIRASAEGAAQVTPDPRAFAGIIERCDRVLAAEQGEPNG